MYISEPTTSEIVSSIEKLSPGEKDIVLILLAEMNMPDMEYLISELNIRKINFIGGIFPSLIHGNEIYDAGVIVNLLPAAGNPVLVTDLSKNTGNIRNQLSSLKPPEKGTAFILVDGLSNSISFFLSALFQQLGLSVKYFGAGAGSVSFLQKPCVFCPEGIYMDAGMIVFIDMDSELGVRHGWKRIMGPLVTTRSEGNIIKELNWSNPFDVYRRAVELDSGMSFDEKPFFEISKGYPFGIYSEGSEDIVRDPVQVNDKGELVCVGEVPENVVLNILKGEKTALIASAGQATRDCFSGSCHVRSCLIIDCISRVLFLGDDFKEELMSISEEISRSNLSIVQEGALTIGEIASREKGILEFFNKTIVVGAFHE